MYARSSSISSCLIFTLFALFLGGCGGESVKQFDNLVPVDGTVSFNGKPLDHGTVSFFPKAKGGQPAIGKISDGKFTMVTTVSAPGVVIGKYKVRIESVDGAVEMPSATAPPPKPGEKRPGPKSLIPEKYNDLATSGLTVDVFDGMDSIEWELKP